MSVRFRDYLNSLPEDRKNRILAASDRIGKLYRREQKQLANQDFVELDEEYAEDVAAADAALKDYEENGGIPWDDLMKQLGLDSPDSQSR